MAGAYDAAGLHCLDRGAPIFVGLNAERLVLAIGAVDEALVLDNLTLKHVAIEIHSRALSNDGINGLIDMSIINVFPGANLYGDKFLQGRRPLLQRFFLYDNRSADDHREALDPYVADGSVTVAEAPRMLSVLRSQHSV